MDVFDPTTRSVLMLTELLGDLLGGVREAAKPPTDSIITAVVAGSLPPCCWGFVAGIESLPVSSPHWLGGESKRVGLSSSNGSKGKRVSEWVKLLKDLIKPSGMKVR